MAREFEASKDEENELELSQAHSCAPGKRTRVPTQRGARRQSPTYAGAFLGPLVDRVENRQAALKRQPRQGRQLASKRKPAKQTKAQPQGPRKQAKKAVSGETARAVTRAAADIMLHRRSDLISSAGRGYADALRSLYEAIVGSAGRKRLEPAQRLERLDAAIAALAPAVRRVEEDDPDYASEYFWSRIPRHRQDLQFLVQSQRVDDSIQVGDQVLDASEPVTEKTWATQRVFFLRAVADEIAALRKINRFVLLADGGRFADAIKAMGSVKTPPGVAWGPLALRMTMNKLVLLDGALKLTDQPLKDRLAEQGISSIPKFASEVIATLGGGLAVGTAFLGALARIGGKLELARTIIGFSATIGKTIGAVIAGIQIIDGLITLFDGDASKREKVDAAVGILTGAGQVAGALGVTVAGAASSGLMLLYFQLTVLVDSYSAALGGIAAMLMQGLLGLNEYAAAVASNARALAKAKILHEREKDPVKKKTLARVVEARAKSCAGSIDRLLAACRKASYATGVAKKPGFYPPIVRRFAKLQKLRGKTEPGEVAAAATAILSEVKWCIENAQTLVEQQALWRARGGDD